MLDQATFLAWQRLSLIRMDIVPAHSLPGCRQVRNGSQATSLDWTTFRDQVNQLILRPCYGYTGTGLENSFPSPGGATLVRCIRLLSATNQGPIKSPKEAVSLTE